MDQTVSRPVRWRTAINRAKHAGREIQSLRDELLATCEELAEKWNEQKAKFADAIEDLEVLKSEYGVWQVPDNMVDSSRLQEKLYRVQDFDFASMTEQIPDLQELVAPLENFDPRSNDDFITLYEAAEVNLPKGYGRD